MNGLDSEFATCVLFFALMFVVCVMARFVDAHEKQNRKYDKALELLYGKRGNQ